MRKSFFSLSILMLLAHALTMPCGAQQAAQAGTQLFPITYGRKNDGLPPKLRVQGTITQVSYAASRCGELVFPATLKVKLDKRVPGYRHPFLYLVVSCLHQPEGAEPQLLNRRIEVNATKQDGKGRPCFSDFHTSSINSRGVPFYCVEREKLLQSVMREPTSSTAAVEFKGTLEEGVTYRALVIRDRAQQWRTLLPLRLPFHHAARIEWLNLKDYPALNTPEPDSHQKQIVFKAVKREIRKVAGQYRWNDTYYCHIASIE